MELIAYLRLLRRGWWVLGLCVLLGAAAATAVTLRTPPRYTATASVFLSPGEGGTIGELAQGSNYTQGLVQSYVRLATTPAVLSPVIDQLGLDTTPADLAGGVSAQAQLQTVLIDITATGDSPELAAATANAVSDQLSRAAQDLAPSAARGSTAITVTTVAPAVPPASASSPDRLLDLAVGVGAGLLAGVALLVVREVLDTRVRDEDDVRAAGAVPLLATVGRERGEGVRRLRATLRLLGTDGAPQVLVVAAAAPSGARGRLAVDLARAAADPETRVLLLEGDVRAPSLARTTGAGPSPGLVGVLLDGVPLEHALQPWAPAGLEVLTAGRAAEDPDDLLASRALRDLLAQLRTRYDVVVVHAPALSTAADAAVLGARADGVVVVAGTGARGGAATRQQLHEGLRDLVLVRARVLGVVLERALRAGRPARRGGPAAPHRAPGALDREGA